MGQMAGASHSARGKGKWLWWATVSKMELPMDRQVMRKASVQVDPSAHPHPQP
jgi:hypothetical protein